MGDEETTIDEILGLNERLLEAIAVGDWETYQELCDPTLTAFEPESCGNLVEGMEFHEFYFQLGGAAKPHNTTLCAPHVRLMGDAAAVCYTRLSQRVNDAGKPTTSCSQETRIWQRQAEGWRHVHFHRSTGG